MTITRPESVSTEPSEFVVVQVTKYEVPAILVNSEVVVKVEPAESVEMITTPESVSTEPSELVVVQVVVYEVNPPGAFKPLENSEVVV